MTDSKSLSKERYRQLAQGYVISQTHAKGTDLDRLIEIAQPLSTWIMLDVATGGGHTALKFSPHVAKVIATDLTPEMLGAAQTFIFEQGVPNISFKVADAESPPFENETFDLITCRIAAHHFPNCTRFVAECHRVLKPNGLLLLQDHVLSEDEITARYTDYFEKLRDPSHHRAYSQSEWIALFQQAGLTVEHTEQVIKTHHFLDWAERQGCTPEIIDQLVVLLRNAPLAAMAWMQPQAIGTPEATFANHHLIIAGYKRV